LPLVTKPARITSSSVTLIDHIYTNIWNKTTTTGIIITDVADHFGTFHSAKNKPTRSVISNIKTRLFSDKNISLFRLQLDESDFTEFFHLSYPNDAYIQDSWKFINVLLKKAFL